MSLMLSKAGLKTLSSGQRNLVKAHAGFGKSNKKVVASPEGSVYTARTNKRRVDLAKELAAEQPVPSTSSSSLYPDVDTSKGNWFELANVSEFKAGNKQRKLIELPGSKQFVVMHSQQGEFFAHDAYSTAYQYPLIDGKIVFEESGPAIETPLDGTIYDLRTGKVLKWCPKDNPVRSLLGTLKSTVDPVALTVYPIAVKPGGKIFVRLS